jgi:RNA polymerase primary sigma factor
LPPVFAPETAHDPAAWEVPIRQCDDLNLSAAEFRTVRPLHDCRHPAQPCWNGPHTIELYLREIGQVKTLTAGQEAALAARARSGSKQARTQLLKSSLRLVVKIAREFDDMGLPLLDLIGEGNAGLLKALRRFDPTGTKPFADVAAWWIRQSIKRALATSPKRSWSRGARG